MGPESQTLAEISRQPRQREWNRPRLQKLPIAATANSSKPGGNSNDGQGGGKGEVFNASNNS